MAYGGGGPTSEMGFNGEHGKISCLRTASITHGSELSFMEFLDLFKSFRFVTLSLSSTSITGWGWWSVTWLG